MRGRWEAEIFMRDPEVFPTMNPDLFGEPMKRMKVDLQVKEGTLIPEDIKAVKKEWKAKLKAKK